MTIIRDLSSPQKVIVKGDSFSKVVSETVTRLTVVQAPASGGGGGSVSTYQWGPPSAQATWMVPHNLNKHPSVTVVDTQGEIVGCKIVYLDLNVISIEFSVPVMGLVYLN